MVVERDTLLERAARTRADLLARARAAVLAGDRDQALSLLHALASAPDASGAELSPELAEALVATARAAERQEDADRQALERYRRAAAARSEILRLLADAPLDRDDLATIASALREREQLLRGEERRRLADERAAPAGGAPEGRRLGAGYLEVKWI